MQNTIYIPNENKQLAGINKAANWLPLRSCEYPHSTFKHRLQLRCYENPHQAIQGTFCHAFRATVAHSVLGRLPCQFLFLLHSRRGNHELSPDFSLYLVSKVLEHHSCIEKVMCIAISRRLPERRIAEYTIANETSLAGAAICYSY